ncbi:MAG: GC-type dockerin domain-anchored protein [bacterium]
MLTGDDFNSFISAFAAGDLLADITGIGGPPSSPDGLITGDDFNAFISAFAAGCP